MTAILSATEDDLYAMPLPMAIYSWNEIGVRCVIFIPSGDNPKLKLAKEYCGFMNTFFEFDTTLERTPTFSQVSRLFGAALPYHSEDEVLITGDSDLCVFGDYFKQLNDGNIHVIGADLTPDEQYPMCFAAMPVKTWRKVYGITKSCQDHLEDLINPIQSDNIRGTNWCLDQFLLKKGLDESGLDIIKHNRSNGQNQFATRRADRDSWDNFDINDIIDAHLPRPLTSEENFNKVYDLFKAKFPGDNFQWLIDYRNAYLKLL